MDKRNRTGKKQKKKRKLRVSFTQSGREARPTLGPPPRALQGMSPKVQTGFPHRPGGAAAVVEAVAGAAPAGPAGPAGAGAPQVVQ